MTNRQKAKGDRAEMAVRNYLRDLGLEVKRTRAGYTDDMGDIILTTQRGLITLQVKDCTQAHWTEWFQQLNSQIQVLKASTTTPVVGGALVWKMRGTKPEKWRVVFQLSELPKIIGES